MDLAVLNFGDPTVNDNGSVSILLGNGDGSFQSATSVSAGKNPSAISAGDFNSDGKSDLLVVRAGDASVGDNGDATIFLGNGDGTFSPGQVLVTGKNPSAVALSDLNADHKLDLIFSNLTDDSVTVLLGNGDGTFQSRLAYLVEGPPKSVSVIDLNQDGKSDLAVGWGISVDFFLGNGDGTFHKGQSVLAYFSTIGDFNQDGKVDLIVGECSIFSKPVSCSPYLRLGNGDGTFQPPNAIPGVSGSVAAVAADVNGDGKLDLFGTSSDRTQLLLFLGNGDGTFQQALTFAAGTNPAIGLIADFDGDKAPDLVALNSGANAISVLLNTGTDFSISASAPSPSRVGPGQSATATLTLTLLNAFDNPASLACSVQPSQVGSPTCALSSNSVTFDSNGKATATLTITAGSSGATLMVPRPYHGDSHPFSLGWLPVAAFGFMGMGLGCGDSRRRRRYLFFVGCVLAGLIFQVACGGGSSGPKSAIYAITITGTSGSTQHSTTTTLTVD
jgi:hypothetical protein